ncbi:MAG: hypothetical protein AAB837_01665 [Patescibacteria group bacterium]
MSNKRRKRDILRRLAKLSYDGLELSRDLFGPVPDHDFELSHYVGFLDKVCSKEDLLRGLQELDPFVDNAHAAAKSMSDEDFLAFKIALKHVRQQSAVQLWNPDQYELELHINPVMQEKTPNERDPEYIAERFGSIIIPERFIKAGIIAKEAATSLEVALGRIYEFEMGL